MIIYALLSPKKTTINFVPMCFKCCSDHDVMGIDFSMESNIFRIDRNKLLGS